jgi:hypothetical protein
VIGVWLIVTSVVLRNREIQLPTFSTGPAASFPFPGKMREKRA